MKRHRSAVLVVAIALLSNVFAFEAEGQTTDRGTDADLSEQLLKSNAHYKEDGPHPRLSKDRSGSPVQATDPYTYEFIFDISSERSCGDGYVMAIFRHVEVVPNDPTTFADDEWFYLFDSRRCVARSAADEVQGGLAAPRGEDVRESVAKRLPVPGLAVDPSPRGVTGMETYLWYEGDGEFEDVDHDGDASTPPRAGLSVTASAGPYSITATAYVSEYRWETGDGAAYASGRPGSHEDPAATHVYETKGDYTVVTETVWVGSYTWTAPGGQSGSGDLGSVVRRSEHDYRVVEIRSVLTD